MPETPSEPRLSVVVPFHDNPGQLELCLQALRRSTAPFELVLVDDASRDPRAGEVAAAHADRCARLEKNSGPAVARNAGAKLATGDVLVFVDSDCVVHQDALARMREALRSDAEAAALFGSYDDSPAHPTVVSTYRNLLHHWVHHRGPREASTFWAGCGAVRKRVFEAVGGFDERYRRPSIEDIELGMRIKAAGHRILLLPDIQCKHLKQWRLFGMVYVDVTKRAVPWTKLLIDRPGTGGDLNLEVGQKLSVVCIFAALLSAPLAWFVPYLASRLAYLWLPLALYAPVLLVNNGLYRLFLRRRGAWFALQGVALHALYFFYGGLAYAWVKLTHRSPSRTSGA
jgi:glycosyltransferase involved in cell wall biosynthesis